MAKVAPVLDHHQNGGTSWVSDPHEVGQLLLTNYLTTDPHQSRRYKHTIASSIDLSNTNDVDYKTAAADVTTSLSRLYQAHFNNVVIDVNISDATGRVVMNIDISWTVDGKSYTITNNNIDTSVLNQIINTHNTGDPLR